MGLANNDSWHHGGLTNTYSRAATTARPEWKVDGKLQ